jgi:ATP-dependent DNA helicase PIF1
MPPHQLQLMVGAVFMVTRNLNCASKLVNGTRLIVESISNHVIICRIITGVAQGQQGELVAIPRITFVADDNCHIKFVRRQFPLRVAFAMTVHKSQGQTLQQLGLHMRRFMFCHGQLYVAMSRVGDPRKIRIMLPSVDTNHLDNIVYPEIFHDDTLSDFSDF